MPITRSMSLSKQENAFPSIKRFSGRDFPVWKAQIQAICESKEMDAPLKIDPSKVFPVEQENYDKADKWVRSLILLSMEDEQVRLVLKCTSSFEMWRYLTTIYEAKSSASGLALQKEFFALSMKQDENVSEYISRAQFLKGQLKDAGIFTVDDTMLADKIVCGLPKQYSSFVSSWNFLPTEKRTSQEVMIRLMAEESLINQFKRVSLNPAGSALTIDSQRFKKRQGRSEQNTSRRLYGKGQTGPKRD